MNQRAEFTWKDTDGGLLVSVRGEIDHHTAAAIRTGMDALLFARRPARLVLDLSAVTFMDSSGLGRSSWGATASCGSWAAVCASGIQARKYAAF